MFHFSNFPALFIMLLVTHSLAKDQVMGYAREELLFVNQPYPIGLKESDLIDLPLNDLKLRVAYMWLIRSAMSGPKLVDERTPEMVATLNDLKRRGDDATPLMLDMMEKNHNTNLEDLIPAVINRIGVFKIAPYVEYLRRMIKTRPDEINANANEIASKIFIEHGTKEDVKMMEDLAKKRPFLAPSLERAFEFQRWKNPAHEKSAVPATAPSSSAQETLPQTEQKMPETKPILPPTSRETTSLTLWSVVAVLILSTFGLLRILLKK